MYHLSDTTSQNIAAILFILMCAFILGAVANYVTKKNKFGHRSDNNEVCQVVATVDDDR